MLKRVSDTLVVVNYYNSQFKKYIVVKQKH